MGVKRWNRYLLAILPIPLLTFSLVLTPASPARASGGWTTSGTEILGPSGQFVIAGISWYGFETTGFVAHGLYAQDYKTIVDEIVAYGYNTIRIPFSNEMWEKNPVPNPNTTSACFECRNPTAKTSREILGLIISYAGSRGLHVILDNHRSTAGNSAEANGLWYFVGKGKSYPESKWLDHWVQIQRWVHTLPNYYASDGFPTVMGYDLRNEPHTPPRTAYLKGATWGSGDVDGLVNPNPDPFSPPCVATGNCHDWRLAAERAAARILGDVVAHPGWEDPLIFVEGISQYPQDNGSPVSGPYDYYWWGGDLQGVNGTVGNPGAPVLLNRWDYVNNRLGAPVYHQLVYSAHDYGPSVSKQGWFNARTTYASMVAIWDKYWAALNRPPGIDPILPPGRTVFPWENTGHVDSPENGLRQAPMHIGEFGTGNTAADVYSTTPGSQGQWFTNLLNFVKHSYSPTSTDYRNLNWTYWAINGEDSFGLLNSGYSDLAYRPKEYSYLCNIEQPYGALIAGCSGALPPPPLP